MNISSFNASYLNANYKTESHQIQKSDHKDFKDLKISMKEQSFSYSYVSFDIQSASENDSFEKDYKDFQTFLSDIGYKGGPIAELTQDEAAQLVSDDGFFGITKTSERIANFVLNGAGNNEDLLRAGRSGILQGFDEAEALWGGKLPDISYKTIDKAVEIIDKAMHEMGYSILNEEV